MSGFVGVLNADGAPVDGALLRRITQSMAYCGPDHQEVWLGESVGLGHALLGATPQPAASEHQPRSLDGRTWIAGDARIDGRTDLIGKLRGQGRDIAPETPDAHLILLAYDAWGEDCLEHLIGDFAFAIWDGSARRLFCARDHFGVIPFYYARAAGGLVFGNVLRSVQLHPAVSDALNDRAIGDFLLFGRNMDLAVTTFADIHALPPAHALTWDGDSARIRRYWAPATEAMARVARPEEHVEGFRTLFDQAVGDRLRASRAGTHLSGGMDCTSVAVTARRVLSSRGPDFDLRAYTLVFEELIAEEEGRYAGLVAEQAGLTLERLVVDDYWKPGPYSPPSWVCPEPGATAGGSPAYETGRRVSTFARALLTGFGGDPLLRSAEPARWRERARAAWLALAHGHVPRIGLRTELRRRLGREDNGTLSLPDWIEPGFARRASLEARLREVDAQWGRVTGSRAMLHPIWPNLFAQAHPGAMGLTVRALFPFFDVRLARYVWETPPHPWRQEKRLLRDAMAGRLPDTTLRRPKTPLYVRTRRTVTDDPRYRIALLPETRRWRAELSSTEGIEEYVDVERLRDLIESPSPHPIPVENCFAFAYWLRFGLASTDQASTKEPHHAPAPAAP